MRWTQFKNLPAQEMFDVMVQTIFPFIKTLGGKEDTAFSKYMKDATFQINKAATLQKVVTALDKLDMADRDTQGDVYEYLLSKLATSGTNGQFRTPRHIIKMIVELMKPTPEDTIIDKNKDVQKGRKPFQTAQSNERMSHTCSSFLYGIKTGRVRHERRQDGFMRTRKSKRKGQKKAELYYEKY